MLKKTNILSPGKGLNQFNMNFLTEIKSLICNNETFLVIQYKIMDKSNLTLNLTVTSFNYPKKEIF